MQKYQRKGCNFFRYILISILMLQFCIVCLTVTFEILRPLYMLKTEMLVVK